MKGDARIYSSVVRRNVRLPYLLYTPQAAAQKMPLLVFLHGLGERGTDSSVLKRVGPPKLIEAGREFPFLVAAPLCPPDSSWVLELDALRGLLHELIRRCPVDTSRIMLTGLSMGGFGTWHCAVENPHAFAAIAPICGGQVSATGLSSRVGAISHLPTWAFHGAKDEVVPIERSIEMVDALRAAGGNVKLTVYPQAGHDSWTETYENPLLYEWLTAQSNASFSLD
jgi:predicted peptidase